MLVYIAHVALRNQFDSEMEKAPERGAYCVSYVPAMYYILYIS